MANKKKMSLVITGVQRMDGQEETNEISVMADYFKKEGKHYLFYSEYTEGGKVINNRMTIGPELVELKKSGNGNSHLQFQERESLNCIYQTAVGPMELVSDTHELKVSELDDGIRLELYYTLYMGAAAMSEYHLTVKGHWIEEE
ncbi:MAG: DUF1934 domain-containing protein [Lachnospiraceae bacterium]|nr:DUF1934 domain-containing protein [Lachnospiraceae bacterium]